MATKKIKSESFIGVDLDWAEEQLTTWKKYVSDNPFGEMKDRISWKETKGGGQLPIVVATIESQQKNVRDTMKDYLALLSVVDQLRQKEAEKKEARGGQSVADIMNEE